MNKRNLPVSTIDLACSKKPIALVIDRYPAIVDSLSRMLEKNYEIPSRSTVTSKFQAEVLIDTHKPDLVFVERRFDPINHDAFKDVLVRAKRRNLGAKVIVHSIFSDDSESGKDGFEFDDVICKGDLGKIREIVHELITQIQNRTQF